MNHTTHGRQLGFTLLEVLLAIAITALVAVMAYSGLSTAIGAAERHGEQVRRLVDLQTTLSWLARDLRQAVNRPVAAAELAEPALWGGEDPALDRAFIGEERDHLLVLSRTGWDNPRGLRRGAIQRVRYRLDADNTLWRDHWQVLDRLDDDDHRQSVRLISGVTEVKVQFLDGRAAKNAAATELGGEWAPRWPVIVNDASLPIAVQVELDVDGIGRIERIVGLAHES
jgi:general secretion pathway protein J